MSKIELRHNSEEGLYLYLEHETVSSSQTIEDDMLEEFIVQAEERGLVLVELDWGWLVKPGNK